jgi:hypothetical protein
MSHPSNCPKCKISWNSETSMPVDLIKHNPDHYVTLEKAEEDAGLYGWTPENDKRFGANVVGIEVRGKYDGVSYWECTACSKVFDRFTMKEHTGEL